MICACRHVLLTYLLTILATDVLAVVSVSSRVCMKFVKLVSVCDLNAGVDLGFLRGGLNIEVISEAGGLGA